MDPDCFPRPIHIASDGAPLHAVLLDKLARSHDATMSINPVSINPVSVKPILSNPVSIDPLSGIVPPADGSAAVDGHVEPSRVRGWVSRQLQLDGAAGLLRDARARLKPGMRYGYAKATAGRAARNTRRSDEDFMALLGVTTPPPTVALPRKIGTLITFGSLAGSAIRAEVRVEQELRVHLGWPAQPGRDGVLSALTHRNVDAICTVVEAVGPVEGYALGHPPLGRDDDPDRIHQRLLALGADMIDTLLREPGTTMDKTPPQASVRSALVDRGAVESDLRSGRLGEVINSITRF